MRKRNSLSILAFVLPHKSKLVLLLLVTTIGTLFSLALPFGVKFVIDDVIGKKRISLLPLIISGLLLAYLLEGLLFLLGSYLYGLLTQGVFRDVRKKMFVHMQKLPIAYFSGEKTGAIVSRFINDVEALRTISANVFLSVINDSLLIFVSAGVLISMDRRLALASLVSVLFFGISFIFFGKKIHSISKANLENQADLASNVGETVAGIKTIKLFAKERFHSHLFDQILQKSYEIGVKLIVTSSMANKTISLFGAIGPLTVLGYGGWQVYQGKLSVGALMAFFALLSKLYAPARGLAQLNLNLRSALAAMDRIADFLNEPVEVGKPVNVRSINHLKLKGNIRFKRVSYTYGDPRFIIKDVSFEIKSGETVVLMGPSGVGKTTIVELLAGLYYPSAGKIEIDGLDIKKIPLSTLRRNIAFATQDTFLFSGTIRENIAYSKPNALEAEIVNAAKAAHAHEFIMRLPSKYETEVGERGVRLSGGEKQRIAIARAYLAGASIVVLDEATSSVDVNSEKLIWKAIGRLRGACTTIIITHRLPPLSAIDRVILMADSQIIATGAGHEVPQVYEMYKDLLKKAEVGSAKVRS